MTVTPNPCDEGATGAPRTTPGPPAWGIVQADAGDGADEPQDMPDDEGWVGSCAVQELTDCAATGIAAAMPESNGPRIQPEGCTIAPGVPASMGSPPRAGALHPVVALGVVQLAATGEGCGASQADAGDGCGDGVGLPHAEEGAPDGDGTTTGVGTAATVGDGGGATTGAVAAARGRALLEARRGDEVREGVPAIGIIGSMAGATTGTTAAGNEGASWEGNEGATGDGATGVGAPRSATA